MIDTADLEVRLTFEIEDPERGTFRDALTIPYDEWHTLTEADIEKRKRVRYEQWVENITNPQPPAPLNPVDPQSQAQTLADQLAQLAQQAQALATQDQAAQDATPPPGE